MSELTQSRLKELLRYDTETGAFTWLVSRGRLARAGDTAGSLHPNGYAYIKIAGQSYRAHRLAWLYMTGNWPLHEIDHIDGNKAHNIWSNLREATRTQNNANKGIQSNNQLGVKGVNRRGGRYMARISIAGKLRHLGCFSTQEEAHAAYVSAAVETHGEFARAG